MGRGLVGGPFVGVACALAHLGNYGLHHVVVGLAFYRIFINLKEAFNLILHLLGDAVGLFNVGAHGHFDVNIGQVGLVVWEEHHLGRNYRHQNKAQHKKSDGGQKSFGGVVFRQNFLDTSLIPSL